MFSHVYHREFFVDSCVSNAYVAFFFSTDASVKQESANCGRINDTNYSQYQSVNHPQSSTFLDLDPENRNNCFG